jgi:hypothetical protein
MKITFTAERLVTYEFAITGETLAEISAKVRQLKAEEAEGGGGRELFDRMNDGNILGDAIRNVRITGRED